MGKISPVSSKYIINATINIEGVVDRPDVIGAIFGQTEGLLGADLELRELQRSGRIGRIEVNVDTRSGKTSGKITIPSSLDKAETSIVAAALEIIQRIGPCNANIKVQDIEDVRISKRKFVIDRAKELLKGMVEGVIPDSQEIAEEVANSVRVMEIREYGKDRLPAGPAIEESDEVIVVEGRADVLNLLKHGFKNAIAMNGTSVPETVAELTRQKTVTAFVDGDRGGNLIIKELMGVAEIDFVTKAPDGKEVEELTKKEIHKALRSKISPEQVEIKDLEAAAKERRQFQRSIQRNVQQQHDNRRPPMQQHDNRRPPMQQRPQQQHVVSTAEKQKFKQLLEDLVGTRGAYILDQQMAILGKVPVTELQTTIKSLSNIHAIVMDGKIEKDLVSTAERARIRYLVAMESLVANNETRMTLLTAKDL